eukprot:TRINITY_DN27116_c0_g1_i1.p1 TRINITY_DN27116_c0_g1~~TRINITY_DN27116_c0_g1_i1.p1  ORF type:complete len:408 (+),score=10.75 TRINITY_DN27116_c0_g1_i1:32-1225(+)
MTSEQAVSFVLSWLAYAGMYLTRKNFSVAKYRMKDTVGLSLQAMGYIDMGYLLSYTGGQVPAGLIVDICGPKQVLVLGLMGSSLISLGFASTSNSTVMIILFTLNGFCQAAGWPSTVKIMAKQFPVETRTRIMALWSTNYQAGGIVGTALAGYLTATYGWRSAFIVPGSILFAIAVLNQVFLPSADPASPRYPHEEDTTLTDVLNMLKSKDILRYGAAYFFVKYIRYAFLFWLPFYLQSAIGLAEDVAAYVSVSLEVGGTVGVVVLGFVPVEHSVLCSWSLGVLSLWLFLYPFVAHQIVVIVPVLVLIGFFLYAPDSIIVGAAAQSLGGPHAAASACSTINAIGSLGAFVQSVLTPYFVQTYGWDFLFYLLSFFSVVAAAILATFPEKVRHGYEELP